MSYLDKNGLQHYHDEAIKPLIQEMPNKVDKPHYKNLINPANTTPCYGSGRVADHLTTASRTVSVFAELKPYTDYVIKKHNDNNNPQRFGVYLCDNVKLNASCKTITYTTTNSPTTAYFNSENYKYLVVFCRTGSGDTVFPDLQLEVGTTATDYVAYGTESHDDGYAVKPDGGLMRVDDLVANLQAQVDALKPKDWTLKGTITSSNGVSVDLTGCTELIIRGQITATGVCNLNSSKGTHIYQFTHDGTREIYIWSITNFLGIDTPVAKYRTTTSSSLADNLNSYAICNGATIASLTKFYLTKPNNVDVVTSCDLKIYAR